MMIVLKPFHTDRRRFSVSMSVTREDITGSVSFEAWCEAGFIGTPAAPSVAAPAAPVVPDMESYEH